MNALNPALIHERHGLREICNPKKSQISWSKIGKTSLWWLNSLSLLLCLLLTWERSLLVFLYFSETLTDVLVFLFLHGYSRHMGLEQTKELTIPCRLLDSWEWNSIFTSIALADDYNLQPRIWFLFSNCDMIFIA